jgi:hypothetical protein
MAAIKDAGRYIVRILTDRRTRYESEGSWVQRDIHTEPSV